MTTQPQRLPRVALVASSFHPHTGGVEEHVRHVAVELRRAGVPVEVWTVDRGEKLGTQVMDGVAVRYLPTPLPARGPGPITRFARAAPHAVGAWVAAHHAFRPDVLHVQCFGPNGLYALALHHLMSTPLVVSSHGETFADDHGAFEGSALLRLGLRHALRRAQHVTGCSSLALQDLRERFGLSGGAIVPNGVDLDEPVGAAAPAPSGRIVFAVGRLVKVKGFDLLLDAAPLLPPDVHVVIGGDGSEEESLQEHAAELGIADRVIFTGRLSRPEVGAWMRRADIVCVPSRREAFGIVVLEAWRAGTAVVATSRGGIGEFATDGRDALLVDPLDTDTLARTLRRLLNDPGKAAVLGAAGAGRVRHLTWKRVAREYLSLYPKVQYSRDHDSRGPGLTR